MNNKILLDYITNQMLTTMPFSYIKCALISMFILVKDESENLILAF
jgi:hypothetical protein